MNRAERRRQEKAARKQQVSNGRLASPPRLDITTIKRQLQQQISPAEVQQLIATLVAQGLPPEAGEELAVYAAEYHDATAILKTAAVEPDDEGVAAVVTNAYSWADTMIEQSPQTQARACRAGCAFCCYVPTVLVSAVEAVSLADWLRTHCSEEEREALRQRLIARQQRTRATPSPSPSQPTPCALLQDNHCMAYTARPLKCRAWNAMRREACEQGYGHSQSTISIPYDSYAFVMGNAVLNGLSDSSTRVGLDGTTQDLTTALLQVFDIPDAAQRWRKGERLFAQHAGASESRARST